MRGRVGVSIGSGVSGKIGKGVWLGMNRRGLGTWDLGLD